MSSSSHEEQSDIEFAEAERLYRQRSYDDAFRIYMRLAHRGRIGCQRFVGWMYLFGEGVQQNSEQAYAWFVKAAERGDREAMFGAGRSCLVLNRHPEALDWFAKGCRHEFPPACFRLGWMYQHGKGCQPDNARAYRHFQAAFERGNLPAGRAIALMLMAGMEGLQGRVRGALLWLNLLAEVVKLAIRDPKSLRFMA